MAFGLFGPGWLMREAEISMTRSRLNSGELSLIPFQNIAIGILSFPSIFMRLGMVGGVITTVGLGILAYIMCWIQCDFKLRHMGVMHFGDAGGVMFGKWGARIFGWGMVMKSMGLAGSHILGGQTAISSISDHAICLVWFGFFMFIASVVLSYDREWHKMWWMCFVSLTCIFTASIITMAATGHQNPNILTKGGAPIKWHAFVQEPTLMDVVGAFTNILFGYGGNMACFSFMSEMRKPNDFKKSFAMSQTIVCCSYLIVGGVIYSYGGQYTTSPALTMGSHTVRIIAYSFALVTILVSGVLGANVGAKYMYINTLRNSHLLTSKSWKAWGIWMLMVVIMWVVGFIVAELIPFFNALLTIISALFSVWFICGAAGMLFLYDNLPALGKYAKDPKPRDMKGFKKKFFLACSILSLIISLAMTPLGLYSAIQTIIDGYRDGIFDHPFAC